MRNGHISSMRINKEIVLMVVICLLGASNGSLAYSSYMYEYNLVENHFNNLYLHLQGGDMSLTGLETGWLFDLYLTDRNFFHEVAENKSLRHSSDILGLNSHFDG